MANFLSKIFGGGKSKKSADDSAQEIVRETLEGVIHRAGFDLSVEVSEKDEVVSVNLSGPDSKLVNGREGVLLDSFQIFVKRMLQNKFPEKTISLEIDCDGFLQRNEMALQDLAEKLKSHVLERGSPSYVRALPPRERKVIHRYIAQDERVRSQSVGDGFCKKIKISLAKPDSSFHGETMEETSL